MLITLADGRRYALNVWVACAVEEIVRDSDDGLSGAYAIGPDLIVRSAERPLREAVFQDLVVRGLLREEWRSPIKEEEP